MSNIGNDSEQNLENNKKHRRNESSTPEYIINCKQLQNEFCLVKRYVTKRDPLVNEITIQYLKCIWIHWQWVNICPGEVQGGKSFSHLEWKRGRL